MKNKPIIVIAGEPNSIFLEIFFKALRNKIYKSPIILICCKKILLEQMKRNKFKKKLNILKLNKLRKYNLNNNNLNLIDVECKKLNKGLNTKLTNPEIIQINSTFYILEDKKKWNILQAKLQEIILAKHHTSVGGRVTNSTFKPEKYPGINVKFKCKKSEKNITILIFSTGSTLINGGNDLEDYRDAYNMLCNVVYEHRDTVLTKSLL